VVQVQSIVRRSTGRHAYPLGAHLHRPQRLFPIRCMWGNGTHLPECRPRPMRVCRTSRYIILQPCLCPYAYASTNLHRECGWASTSASTWSYLTFIYVYMPIDLESECAHTAVPCWNADARHLWQLAMHDIFRNLRSTKPFARCDALQLEQCAMHHTFANQTTGAHLGCLPYTTHCHASQSTLREHKQKHFKRGQTKALQEGTQCTASTRAFGYLGTST